MTEPKKKLKLRTRYLLFIDTNIYLNFYESFNKDYLSLLKKLEKKANIIISTCQVEMEFKKQRQRVIVNSIENIKNNGKVKRPNICFDDKAKMQLEKEISNYNKLLEDYAENIFEYLVNPIEKDPVYITAEKVFRKHNLINLTIDSKNYKTIKELAEERFRIGSPPRKGKDNSIGDAINWEWIIKCSQDNIDEFDEFVLVSGDHDFGIHLNKVSILNDWLLQEFQVKVPNKKIHLKQTLIEAFDLIDVKISKKERIAQEKILKELKLQAQAFTDNIQEQLRIATSSILPSNTLGRFMDEQERLQEKIYSGSLGRFMGQQEALQEKTNSKLKEEE